MARYEDPDATLAPHSALNEYHDRESARWHWHVTPSSVFLSGSFWTANLDVSGFRYDIFRLEMRLVGLT